MGCPRSPTPLSQDRTDQHATKKAPRPEFGKSNPPFFPGEGKRRLKPKLKAWLPSACTGSIQVWPSQRLLLELLIGCRRYYANQGESRPIKVPAVEFGATSIHCTTMPTDTEMDMSEFMRLTKEKDTSESMMPTDKEIDMSGSVLLWPQAAAVAGAPAAAGGGGAACAPHLLRCQGQQQGLRGRPPSTEGVSGAQPTPAAPAKPAPGSLT